MVDCNTLLTVCYNNLQRAAENKGVATATIVFVVHHDPVPGIPCSDSESLQVKDEVLIV
jgi:hypothetical protein